MEIHANFALKTFTITNVLEFSDNIAEIFILTLKCCKENKY
jgi:hypothetical protein